MATTGAVAACSHGPLKVKQDLCGSLKAEDGCCCCCRWRWDEPTSSVTMTATTTTPPPVLVGGRYIHNQAGREEKVQAHDHHRLLTAPPEHEVHLQLQLQPISGASDRQLDKIKQKRRQQLAKEKKMNEDEGEEDQVYRSEKQSLGSSCDKIKLIDGFFSISANAEQRENCSPVEESAQIRSKTIKGRSRKLSLLLSPVLATVSGRFSNAAAERAGSFEQGESRMKLVNRQQQSEQRWLTLNADKQQTSVKRRAVKRDAYEDVDDETHTGSPEEFSAAVKCCNNQFSKANKMSTNLLSPTTVNHPEQQALTRRKQRNIYECGTKVSYRTKVDQQEHQFREKVASQRRIRGRSPVAVALAQRRCSTIVMWPSWWRQLVILSFLTILLTTLLTHLNLFSSGAGDSDPCSLSSLFNHCHALSISSTSNNQTTPTLSNIEQVSSNNDRSKPSNVVTIPINITTSRPAQSSIARNQHQQLHQLLTSASSDVVVVAQTSTPVSAEQSTAKSGLEHSGGSAESQRIVSASKASAGNQLSGSQKKRQQQVTKQHHSESINGQQNASKSDHEEQTATLKNSSSGGGNNGPLKFSFSNPTANSGYSEHALGLSIEDGQYASSKQPVARASSARVQAPESRSSNDSPDSQAKQQDSDDERDEEQQGSNPTSDSFVRFGVQKKATANNQKKLISVTGNKQAPQEFIQALSATSKQTPFVPIINAPPQQSSSQAIKVIAAPQSSHQLVSSGRNSTQQESINNKQNYSEGFSTSSRDPWLLPQSNSSPGLTDHDATNASRAHLTAAMAANWNPEPAYLLSSGPLASPPSEMAFMHRLPPPPHQLGGHQADHRFQSSQLFGLSMPHEIIQPGAGAQWFQLDNNNQNELINEQALFNSALASASANQPLVMRPQQHFMMPNPIQTANFFNHLYAASPIQQALKQGTKQQQQQRPPQRPGKRPKKPNGQLLSTASASAPSISLPPLSHLLSPRNPFRLFSSSSTPIGSLRRKPSAKHNAQQQNSQQQQVAATRQHHWTAAQQQLGRPFGFQGTAKLTAMDPEPLGSGGVSIGSSLYAHPHSAEQLEQLVRAASQATGVHTPILPAIVSGPAGQTIPGFYIPAIESESESQINELRHNDHAYLRGNLAAASASAGVAQTTLTSRIPGTDYILHPEEVRAMMSVGESAYRNQQSAGSASSESQNQYQQQLHPSVDNRWRQQAALDMLMRENHAQNLRDFAYVDQPALKQQSQQHPIIMHNGTATTFPAIIRLNDQDYIHWPLIKVGGNNSPAAAQNNFGQSMAASNEQQHLALPNMASGWRINGMGEDHSRRQYQPNTPAIGPFHALYAAASGQPPAPSTLPALNQVFAPQRHPMQPPGSSFLPPPVPLHQMSKQLSEVSQMHPDQAPSASSSSESKQQSNGQQAPAAAATSELPPENSPVRLATQLTPSEISQVEDSIVETLLMAQQLQRQRRLMRQFAASLQAPVYAPHPLASRVASPSNQLPVRANWRQPPLTTSTTPKPKGLQRLRSSGLFRRRRRNSAPSNNNNNSNKPKSVVNKPIEQLLLSPELQDFATAAAVAASPLVAPLVQLASLSDAATQLDQQLLALHLDSQNQQQRRQFQPVDHLQSSASQHLRQTLGGDSTVMADQETNRPFGFSPSAVSALDHHPIDLMSVPTEPRSSIVSLDQEQVPAVFGGRLSKPANQLKTSNKNELKSSGTNNRGTTAAHTWNQARSGTSRRPVDRINVDWPAMASDADYFPPQNTNYQRRPNNHHNQGTSESRRDHTRQKYLQRAAAPSHGLPDHRLVSQVFTGSGSSQRPHKNTVNNYNFLPSQLKLQFAQDYQDREGVPIYNNNVRVAGAVDRRRHQAATTTSHRPQPARHESSDDQYLANEPDDQSEAAGRGAASTKVKKQHHGRDSDDVEIEDGDGDLARGRSNKVEAVAKARSIQMKPAAPAKITPPLTSTPAKKLPI